MSLDQADPAQRPGLGARAARGAATSLGAQALRTVVQFLSVVVLSRLLVPEDYGLVAMVMVVIGVADLLRDFGLSMAAVQAKTLSDSQRSNLFWLNTAFGLVLMLLALALAPALAALYDEPRLVELTQVLACTFFLNGIATQYRADLTRRYQFGRLAVADVGGPLAGLVVAIVLAVLGAGFWALAAQQLVQIGVMTVLVCAGGRWLPGRPDRRAPMGDLLRFGRDMVGVQVVGYVGENIDTLTIGTRFGAEPLGLYNRGFQLLMTPLGQVRGPATLVAVPVLSELQDDQERFSAFLRRGQLALGYTVVAMLGLVIGAAGPITDVLLGDGWADVAPILRVLGIAGVFQTLAFVAYWVYVSRGLTGHLVRYSLLQAVIRVVCILGGSAWGVLGVAAGYALAPALGVPLSLWWLSRATVIPVRELAQAALRILTVVGTVAVASGAVAGALDGAPAVAALAAACLAGIGAGAALCSLAAPLRRDLVDVVEVGRLALRRRRPTDPRG